MPLYQLFTCALLLPVAVQSAAPIRRVSSKAVGVPEGGQSVSMFEVAPVRRAPRAVQGKVSTPATYPKNWIPTGEWMTAYGTHYDSFAPCCTSTEPCIYTGPKKNCSTVEEAIKKGKKNPRYNSSVKGDDLKECSVYNACNYAGKFAYFGDYDVKNITWVKNHNVVAFYQQNLGDDGQSINFGRKIKVCKEYKGKFEKGGLCFVAHAYDTCSDKDCPPEKGETEPCCTRNSNKAKKDKVMIDVEYFTGVKEYTKRSKSHIDIDFTDPDNWDGHLKFKFLTDFEWRKVA